MTHFHEKHASAVDVRTDMHAHSTCRMLITQGQRGAQEWNASGVFQVRDFKMCIVAPLSALLLIIKCTHRIAHAHQQSPRHSVSSAYPYCCCTQINSVRVPQIDANGAGDTFATGYSIALAQVSLLSITDRLLR